MDATALHFAIRFSHYKAALKLIKGGAKLDGKDNSGRSPLHEAARKGSDETIGVLLKHDADINAVDRKGYTTLHVAIICAPPVFGRLSATCAQAH